MEGALGAGAVFLFEVLLGVLYVFGGKRLRRRWFALSALCRFLHLRFLLSGEGWSQIGHVH